MVRCDEMEETPSLRSSRRPTQLGSRKTRSGGRLQANTTIAEEINLSSGIAERERGIGQNRTWVPKSYGRREELRDWIRGCGFNSIELGVAVHADILALSTTGFLDF